MTAPPSNIGPARRLLVLGASAGGFDALRSLLAELPSDLPAAIAIVIHTSTLDAQRLAHALGSRTSIEVVVAEAGAVPRNGRAYIAPAHRHLLLRDREFRLSSGPVENGARPSIDVLFRSAAAEYGAACVGVVLSGANDDGAQGLSAIARSGGAAFVQDPAEASFDRMPRAAYARVPDAHVVSLRGLAARLVRQCESSIASTRSCPTDVRDEADFAYHAGARAAPSEHRDLAGALWAAERLLTERAHLLASLSASSQERSREYAGHAARIRELLAQIIGSRS